MARLIMCALLFCALASAEDQISRIGNKIVASPSGVDVEGAIFLLNDVSLEDGVVFAFSAFFRTDSKIIIQMWRPTNDTQGSDDASNFELIGELPVIPSVTNSREDIYFEAKLREDECVRVKKGDRVGVYFVEAPGAIAYKFNSQDPQAFSNTLKNASDPYRMGDVVAFDSLVFPYDFSLSAYVDTDTSKFNESDLNGDLVRCPPQMIIPPEEEVTPMPSTTITPAPGATGATGPQGNQGATGPTGPVGATGPEGAVGATGLEGPMGANGTDGDDGGMGATGYTGPNGRTGATGVAGPKGDQGERGPAGPAGRPADAGSVSAEEMDLMKEGLILGFLVWLIIITVLLIILVIITCIAWRRSKKTAERTDVVFEAGKPHYDNNAQRGRMASENPSIPDPAYANMREETESQYSMETIERDGKPSKNGHHVYDNAGLDASDVTLSKDEVANY